jgi:hypothetical protein
MVVGSALTLDMAVLLKQKAGDRPFRIFTSIGAARSWLKSYQEKLRSRGLRDRTQHARPARRLTAPRNSCLASPAQSG